MRTASFLSETGVVKYMTREHVAFLGVPRGCLLLQFPEVLSSCSQRAISPRLLWVGAACRTIARVDATGGGSGSGGEGGDSGKA